MQRGQPFTHPRTCNYALCFQVLGSSTHRSWLWQTNTTLEEMLPSPHTLCLHGWYRLWVYHHCSAVKKNGRYVSECWIRRWNLPQCCWVCHVKQKPRNIGLDESTFAEVIWTARAWFGSLKTQGGAQFGFWWFCLLGFCLFVCFFIAHLAPLWSSLRAVGWRMQVALTLAQMWCTNECL